MNTTDIETEEPKLATRLERIKSLCREIEQIRIRAGKDALPKAIEIGRLLVLQKAETSHGRWLYWVKNNFEYGKSTAENWMALYRKSQSPNSHLNGNMTLTEAIKLLPNPAKKAKPGHHYAVQPVIEDGLEVKKTSEKESILDHSDAQVQDLEPPDAKKPTHYGVVVTPRLNGEGHGIFLYDGKTLHVDQTKEYATLQEAEATRAVRNKEFQDAVNAINSKPCWSGLIHGQE